MMDINTRLNQDYNNSFNNWTLQIAQKVVSDWLGEEQVGYNYYELLDSVKFFDRKIVSTIITQLKFSMRKSRASINSFDKLKIFDRNANQHFQNQILKKLQYRNQQSRTEIIHSATKLFSEINFKQGSPKKKAQYFANISEYLVKKREYYEMKRFKCSCQAKSALDAYFILGNQLKDSVNKSLEFCCLKECTYNAIITNYEFELKAENYARSSQLCLSLADLSEFYYDSAKLSDTKLKSIYKSIEQKISKDSVPDGDLSMIDSHSQKLQMEVWIGHHWQYWGKTPVSWQQIEGKLLQNIQSIILNQQNGSNQYLRYKAQKSKSLSNSKTLNN